MMRVPAVIRRQRVLSSSSRSGANLKRLGAAKVPRHHSRTLKQGNGAPNAWRNCLGQCKLSDSSPSMTVQYKWSYM